MPVTELAILQLRRGFDELEFLETLMQCQELQDEWIHSHQPCDVEPSANFSSMYIERPAPGAASPPSLLITAPWESPQAHCRWIRSQENQACNGKLSEFIAPGCDSVLLFHMEPAGGQPQLHRTFVSQGTFNVCRITVDRRQRHALQEAYRSLEDDVFRQPPQHKLWAGWRIEKSGDADDLVVFWADGVPDERLRRLTSFSDNLVLRRFEQIV